MKKNISFLLLLLTLASLFVPYLEVNAASYTATITDREGVNIRSGAGTGYGVVAAVAYNSTVTLVSNTKYPGSGCSSGWYQINYGGSTERYLCSELVSVSENTVNSGSGYYTSSFDTRIIEDYATVWSSSSYAASAIDRIFLGSKVNIIDSDGNRYKITYENGKVGWVNKRLCKNYSEIAKTDDPEYNAVLRSAGFPESYIPFLSYLHSIHPTWVFVADQTNKDFATAVSQEIGKNYMQTNRDSHKLNPYPAEGVDWYVITSPVIAVFMDPRNYLTEASIFAFEALSYNSTTQTSSIVSSIFGSSYLNDPTYISYFMNAGASYNISPVHLAARVRQEGGTNAWYDAINGTSGFTYNGNSLNGIYNYYNIGAYGDSPIQRGLAVAAGYISYGVEGTPWNTREKAIMYGAKWIAEGYISQGQDTVYYQKFNTKASSSYAPYTHQYMTNVLGPASESLSSYSSYSDLGLLETPYTFYIPVYDNMPSEYTILPPVGDTNNYLYDLKVNDVTVTGFDRDVKEYTTYVPYNTTSVNITASLESANASIVGLGGITISSDNTTANVIVTSQTGSSNTYKINIIRLPEPTPGVSGILTPEEIANKMDIKFSNGYMTYIAPGTTATALINEAKSKEATANVTIKDINGNIKTNESLATGDTITIDSDSKTQNYTIVIKGDNNGDGIISAADLLRTQKHILKYITLTGPYANALDNNYDNKVSAADLLRTQKYILGYLTFK